jgi:hypothetical protein
MIFCTLQPFLLRLDFLRLILPALADPKLRCALISEKVAPHINFLMKLLGHSNPAIRFRVGVLFNFRTNTASGSKVAHFLADLAAIELCPMVKLFYSHLEQMITGQKIPPPLKKKHFLHSDHLSPSADFCRCGAVELLARLALMGDRLLGVCSLLALLTLRAIGDRLESVGDRTWLCIEIVDHRFEQQPQPCSVSWSRCCPWKMFVWKNINDLLQCLVSMFSVKSTSSLNWPPNARWVMGMRHPSILYAPLT